MDTLDFDKLYLLPGELKALKRYVRLKVIPVDAPCLDALGQLRFIGTVAGDSDNQGGFNAAGFAVNDRGRRYLLYRADQCRRFWTNSILVPVLVAIITAFITVYILPSAGKRAEAWLDRPSQQSEPAVEAASPADDASGTP